MKNSLLLLTIISLVFNSCNSNKVDILGDFVKVQSKNEKFNVVTFDFDKTLTINENGDNYLIADENGNKSIGIFEKGVISLNNECSILVDKANNVLIKTCQQGNSSYSSDYWPLTKAKEYMKNQNNVQYRKYLDERLLKAYGGYNFVPSANDMPENEKKYVDEKILKENPFYPFMCFGDFNGDNKYPDIGVIIGNAEAGYDKEYFDFIVIHAGKKGFVRIKGDFFPFIETLEGMPGGGQPLQIKNVPDFSIRTTSYEKNQAFDYVWNGRRYEKLYINMH